MMSGMKKILGLAGAALLAGTFAASAATLSVGMGNGITALKSNFNPDTGAAGNGNELSSLINVGDAIHAFTSAVNGGSIGGGLMVDAFSKITVKFLGKEAGATDYFVEGFGMNKIRNKLSALSDAPLTFTQGAGFVNFSFQTLFPVPVGAIVMNGGTTTDANASLAFSKVMNSGTRVYAFFDDGSPSGAPDLDYDDMVVQIDVQAIPLPAGGLLLLTGLAGLAATRRRKV